MVYIKGIGVSWKKVIENFQRKVNKAEKQKGKKATSVEFVKEHETYGIYPLDGILIF